MLLSSNLDKSNMRNILSFLFACIVLLSQAQTQKYWVFFKNKTIESQNPLHYVSKSTLENRTLLNLPLFQTSDVPVTPEYLKEIQGLGIHIIQKSKWLNAISVHLKKADLPKIQNLSFVQTIQKVQGQFVPCGKDKFLDNEKYYVALKQMNAEAFVNADLTANNVKVGITDVGFSNANHEKTLKHIFQKKNFILGNNYVGGKKIFSPYGDSDTHGTTVWKRVAGYTEKTKTYDGLAVNAQFYLAITDHSVEETRQDEDNWIRALEWMDSLGVRVINTSLGYNTFDDVKDNYKIKDMNGNTSIVAQGASKAWKEKGITLVMSAGNEGSGAWQIVTTPGDVEAVISVGATNQKHRNKIYYSSKGADFVPFLKPDVSCYSPNGTSFSAPLITGVVACMLEKNPRLSNDEIKLLLQKSSHLYPYANNFLGYGVPQLDIVLEMLEKRASQELVVKGKSYTFDNLTNTMNTVIIFHKKDKWFVVKQDKAHVKEGKLEIKKHKRAKRSTVDLGNKIIEIFWEE